jgi:HTH-type transcriptional regulator/antitoxin HigA
MDLKPIRIEAQHRAARAMIERRWDAHPGTADHDRLEVLATLVEAYERAHHPIPPLDPIAAVQFRMEQLGLRRKDLERVLGSRARVSEVLNRRRRLSLAMIRRLHVELGISADVLLAG